MPTFTPSITFEFSPRSIPIAVEITGQIEIANAPLYPINNSYSFYEYLPVTQIKDDLYNVNK